MDREQLYKNLAELEKQLQRVKSANEQVERVIESDRQLADGISDYITKADDLLKTVKSSYDEAASKLNERANLAVKETTQGLLSEYKSEVEDVRNNYNTSMKESVDSFKNVVDAEKRTLQTKVAALTQLVDEKLVPLRDSLSSIVDGKLVRIPEEFKGVVSESKVVFDSSAEALKNASEAVSKECSKMAEKAEVLSDKVENLSLTMTNALSANKERILAKLSEIDADSISEKVASAMNEQTSHLDGELDSIGNALNSSIAQVERSLGDSISKIGSKVISLENNLTTLQEKIHGIENNLNFVKTMSIVLVVISILLLILSIV